MASERTLLAGLERIVDHLQDQAGDVRLRVLNVDREIRRRNVAAPRGTPWWLAGRYRLLDGPPYGDLYEALVLVEDDRQIERAFDRQRLSRITLVYFDQRIGKPREYTLASIGPWEAVISRARRKLDPDAPPNESITVRYDEEADIPTQVQEIRIWLAKILATEVHGGGASRAKKAAPKKARAKKAAPKKAAPKKAAPKKSKARSTKKAAPKKAIASRATARVSGKASAARTPPRRRG